MAATRASINKHPEKKAESNWSEVLMSAGPASTSPRDPVVAISSVHRGVTSASRYRQASVAAPLLPACRPRAAASAWRR